MGIRSFLNRVNDNINRERETELGNQEEIDRMKETDYYRNNRYVRIILDMGAANLEKVTFGTRFIPNINSVYQNFGITDPDESIIITVRRKEIAGGIFSKEHLVITDKALYVHALNLGREKYRFPLELLSKYVATISDDKTTVDLMNAEGRHPVMARFFVSSNKGEAEQSIVKIIKAIQKDIVDNTDYGKRDRDELCDWIVDTIKKETYETKLSYGIGNSLRSMFTESSEYQEKLVQCLLQYFIASADVKLLQNCIQDLFTVLPVNEISRFKDDFIKELKRYETLLQDPQKFFDNDYLSKALKNIKTQRIIDDERTGNTDIDTFVDEILQYYNSRVPIIRKYLEIRGDLSRPFLTLYSEGNIDDFTTSEEADTYFKFACTYKNLQMAGLMAKIKQGEEPSKVQMKWVDGFGFDALHYSIFLNKISIANKIIDIRKSSAVSVNNIPEELLNLYDYGIIATILNEEDLAYKVMDFSEDIKPMIDSLKSLNNLLKLSKATLSLKQKSLSSAESIYRKARNSNEYDQNRVEAYREQIDDLREEIRKATEDIQDLEYDIREAEFDLDSCKISLKDKYREESKHIQNATSSIEWLFCHIYKNPNEYETLLKEGYEGYICYFYGVPYYIPLKFKEKTQPKDSFNRNNKTSENDNSGKNQERKYNWNQGQGSRQHKQTNGSHQTNSSTTKFNKPYGNHWFSPDAYNDINILRKEYHKLVGKYHPDNNPNGIDAFLDIQQERSIILDNLSAEK